MWGGEAARLRTEDAQIRGRISSILGSARKSVESADVAWRREFLPPPSRAKPRHEATAIAGAQTIERLSRTIGALQGKIGAQLLPEATPALLRRGDEVDLLKKVLEWDEILVTQADQFRDLLEGKGGSWMIENSASIDRRINEIHENLRHRQILFVV